MESLQDDVENGKMTIEAFVAVLENQKGLERPDWLPYGFWISPFFRPFTRLQLENYGPQDNAFTITTSACL